MYVPCIVKLQGSGHGLFIDAELTNWQDMLFFSAGSRDNCQVGYTIPACTRCGVIGPALSNKLQRLVDMRGLQDNVAIHMCSHIGGHKVCLCYY